MALETTSVAPRDSTQILSAFRWVLLALVVLASALNYVDRQIIALLKPMLSQEFGWTDRDYAHIVSGFQFAAAAAYVGAGWFVDRMGVRWGYPIAVIAWSIAAMAHAGARTVFQFVMARVVLGATESTQTPLAVKTIAESFAPRERSLAMGIMNCGANAGAVLTPLIVPVLALSFGWRATFFITGAAGFVWAVLWFALVRGKRASPAASDAPSGAPPVSLPAPLVPWSVILRDRRTWAIAGVKLIVDPVWWFLLFWLPDFMHRVFNLDLKTFGPPLAVIYTMAMVGSLAGGVLPAWLLRKGVTLNAARKSSLLTGAVLVTVMPFALVVPEYWQAMLIVGFALAAHQVFAVNVFSLTADLFHPSRLGRVIGVGALIGNLAGLAMLEITGWVLERTGSYWPMFIYCASAYLAGLLLIQILVPKITPHDAEQPA
jgi:ACS family hexuronate transporter-like MFS transporter